MRTHAILDEHMVVSQIQEMSEEQVVEACKCSFVIDINDLVPAPQVGWKFVGNQLVPPVEGMTNDEKDAHQQTAQRVFGQKILISAIDQLGARNLKLSREETPANVVALATAMSSMKLLLETGALKTVRDLCNSVKGNFPNHGDILQGVVDQITTFLNENGWS